MVKIKVSITVSPTRRRPVMVGEKKYNNIQLLPLMKFLVVAKQIAVHTISGLQKGVQSVSMDKKLRGDVDPVNKKFELLNDKAKFISKAWGKVTETLAPLPGVESVFMDKELTGDIDPVNVTLKVSEKAVFKLALHNDKTKQKAIRTVGGIAGIVSIALDMKDKILTVIGDIDPVHVVSKLRKICYTEIVSVGPAKVPEKKKGEPKKGEPKRQEEKKKDPIDSLAELVRPYKAYNPHIEGNQMISETSGKQGSEATSQRIEHKILEIQEMHGQSYPSSSLGQNDMPAEISPEATIQNRMINLSGGRYDKSNRGVESVSMDKKLTGDIDPVNKRKAVFKVEVLDDKTNEKAMKAVSGLAGVDSISLNMKDKTLTVTGDIDPIIVGIKLRKICHTEIVGVGPAKEVEKKKEELIKAYKAYNPHIKRYQMISETSGKQGSKATSQRIEPKILQIQEMHEQSYPSSSLGQNDMPAEISPEATIQNRMINLSGGRYHIRIDRTLNTIVESIKSPDIGKIGVYGRAGVGKTTLMEALKDLPEIRSMFDGIIWVTIPKTWNLIEVQTLIARLLSFSEIDDGHKDTAIYLSERLKFLLIVDDVGEHINLKMAGIPKPIPENGSKIVLMTRSQQVCETMAVDVKIRLEDLLYWELFCQNVGEVVDSPNIQPIAKQLVEMCCHNSHAIVLMAGALKDVSDVDVWKNALEWLSPQPASYGENLENLLIDVLKFSCKHLADDTTRKCLRYCVQHCEKEEIVIESLIHLWIADGLVDTHLEGNQILQNLINANLLESVKEGVFVKLRYIVRHVLVNSIIQPEEGKLFLMSGGLGLTEPPKEEEWENAKEIQLMDNELSELPENPRCPMLSALFLQRNYKLRLIPPSFFDYMPALQVLNLSSTRIRSLPESLFRLVSLRRLFLNDCCNFMMLSPKVGELKQLEVLDLEGTEIMDLPREMKNLTRLKCLEVSLYGHANDGRRVKQSNAMVHSGIISALSELEELNIDVKPDDEQWYACAEAIVNEVCSLMKLSALKFYFPRVELLSHFEWNSTSMVYPVLSNFRFIVGDHVRRIMTRLPRDVEFELERWDRCLKYINGVGVPREIQKVLRHATAFHLDRHTTVKKLTEFGIENMEHLKCCVVGECNELQVIIDAADFLEEDDSGEIVPKMYGDRRTGLESLEFLYIYFMKNLKSIWEGPLQKKSLILLKSLTLCTCPQLTTIFTRELLDNLCNLEELTVEDCPAIISIVSCETSTEYNTAYFLPKLRKISLHYLPELTSISNGLHIAPKLEWMSFYDCPNLKSLTIEEVSSKDLKKIKGESSWWEALERRSGCKDYVNGIFVPVNMCD